MAIPNIGLATKSRILYLPARPPAQTSHRTDSLESDKRLLLLKGGGGRNKVNGYPLPLLGIAQPLWVMR